MLCSVVRFVSESSQDFFKLRLWSRTLQKRNVFICWLITFAYHSEHGIGNVISHLIDPTGVTARGQQTRGFKGLCQYLNNK